MPQSTQWDLIESVANSVSPVYDALVKKAAQGSLFYIDDTWARILEVIQNNKKASKKSEKKGMHTTGIISEVNSHRIILFLSGTKHAGKNLNDLLKLRYPDLDLPLQMNDALSCNNPKGLPLKTINCHCMAHGRRKFVEIAHYFPDICDVVINALSTVYKNDAFCKEENFNPKERLKYHQKHSLAVMKKLKKFMNKKLSCDTALANSSIGKAFNYWLKRWDSITRFLTVAGAPKGCLLYTSPSPRDVEESRMPSSA